MKIQSKLWVRLNFSLKSKKGILLENQSSEMAQKVKTEGCLFSISIFLEIETLPKCYSMLRINSKIIIITKSDPPMPILTTSVMAFPENPFQFPEIISLQNCPMWSKTALTSVITSLPSTKIGLFDLEKCNNIIGTIYWRKKIVSEQFFFQAWTQGIVCSMSTGFVKWILYSSMNMRQLQISIISAKTWHRIFCWFSWISLFLRSSCMAWS